MQLQTCAKCGHTGPARPFEGELQECPLCYAPCAAQKTVEGFRLFVCSGKLDSRGMIARCTWSVFAMADIDGAPVKLTGPIGAAAQINLQNFVPFFRARLEEVMKERAYTERLTTRRCLNATCKNYLAGVNGKRTCASCAEELISTDLKSVCRNRTCKAFDKIAAEGLCVKCGVKLTEIPMLTPALKLRFRIDGEGKAERIAPETKGSEPVTA